MTLAELRYLVAVADLSHFGRAAERCRITQPTLSSQLRKLEDSLGVSLVERTTRFVTLTPIGAEVVAHARRILEAADQITELVRHRPGTLMSGLRLGIIPTLSPYILPLLLDRLHKHFPGLRLALREDLTANLMAALDTYALDVLLIALPAQTDGYRSMPLFLEPFSLACPIGHRLSNRPVVTARELRQERLLLLDEGHCLRDQALEVCGHQFNEGQGSSDDFRATSLETISEMVAAGLGCTLLPAMAVPHLTARHKHLEVRPLIAAKAHRRIGLLWRASFPSSEDLIEFGRVILGQLPDCVEPIGPVATGARAAAPKPIRRTAAKLPAQMDRA
ncbi:MAG TPA: LysR substrate-binding domain-containing protein [Acetobacteraceae bacterium]|nr:LysR substrate-binding domain-containing protein [Acetobacteraceae bacterium]